MMETRVNGKLFEISIEEESDISQDGGYTFEMVTNIIELTKEEAMNLVSELNEFIND